MASPLDPKASRAHEQDDARRRWTVVGATSLAMLLGGTFVGAAWLLHGPLARDREVDRPRSALEGARLPADGPPLQPSLRHDRTQQQDLAAMRTREDAVFATLGWQIDPVTHAAIVPDAIIARLHGQPAGASSASSRPTTAGTPDGGER